MKSYKEFLDERKIIKYSQYDVDILMRNIEERVERESRILKIIQHTETFDFIMQIVKIHRTLDGIIIEVK